MSVLHRLRKETRDLHDRLEAVVDVERRTADTRCYGELLAALRSVYAPLERELDTCPWTADALPDWPQRRKTGWLDEDLAALAVRPLDDTAIAHMASVEHVVGTAYVMEGATLGGAVVARQLRPELPRRFFTAYGTRRGAMWRGFRSRVDRLTALDEQATVDAARAAFAAFAVPFERPS